MKDFLLNILILILFALAIVITIFLFIEKKNELNYVTIEHYDYSLEEFNSLYKNTVDRLNNGEIIVYPHCFNYTDTVKRCIPIRVVNKDYEIKKYVEYLLHK